MEVVVELLRSQTGLSLLLLAGSLVVGRLLRTPTFLSLVAVAAPLSIQHLDIPLIVQARSQYPAAVFSATWASVFALGLAWQTGAPAVGGVVGRVGILRASYIIALFGSLAVVALLFLAPETLVQCVPNWRSTFGGLLLGASLLGVSRAFARVVQAGVMLAVWSGVSLVLASQVFLHKMPHAIRKDDLTHLEGVFSSEMVGRAFSTLTGVLYSGNSWVRAFGVSLIDQKVADAELRVRGVAAKVLNDPDYDLAPSRDQNIAGRNHKLVI